MQVPVIMYDITRIVYHKSCDIGHPWDQTIAECNNFLDIGMLYLLYILVYPATSWTDLII